MEKEGLRLTHRDCGGGVYEDWADPFRYEYSRGDGTTESQPRTRCRRCGAEIAGDGALEFVGEGAESANAMYSHAAEGP